jgi:hypothetical protein
MQQLAALSRTRRKSAFTTVENLTIEQLICRRLTFATKKNAPKEASNNGNT